MSNMSYCRMENTLEDLEDCFENWELNEEASEYEKKAKKKIIALSKEILKNEGFKITNLI